jgi:hypothetical protein
LRLFRRYSFGVLKRKTKHNKKDFGYYKILFVEIIHSLSLSLRVRKMLFGVNLFPTRLFFVRIVQLHKLNDFSVRLNVYSLIVCACVCVMMMMMMMVERECAFR